MSFAVSNVSSFEVIWCILASIGTIHLGYLWWQALQDEARLKRAKINGIRSIVARMNVRSEFSALLVMTSFLVLGILALLTPPNDHAGDPRSFPLLAGVTLMIVAIVKDVDAVLRRQERRLIFETEQKRAAEQAGRR